MHCLQIKKQRMHNMTRIKILFILLIDNIQHKNQIITLVPVKFRNIYNMRRAIRQNIPVLYQKITFSKARNGFRNLSPSPEFICQTHWK